MSLSKCLITAGPAERQASIREPLRPYAEEIPIDAASRVDDEEPAGYAIHQCGSATSRAKAVICGW